MDFNFRSISQPNRKTYLRFQGIVTEINPMIASGGRNRGCSQMVTVEGEDGSIVNFVISPETYVVDSVTLFEGMPVVMFYDADAPAPLIYPPQYRAAVAAQAVPGQNIAVGYFDRNLTSEDLSLRLNIGVNTQVLTMNYQMFTGSPVNRNLIVVYGASTRSIPAQTTPDRVIVMCGNNM